MKAEVARLTAILAGNPATADGQRLVDANALESAILKSPWYDNADEDVAYGLVRNAPTVEAEPVRHGWWKSVFRGCAVCSACGQDQDIETFVGNATQKYCARCGARMDAQRKDGGDHDA